MRRNPRKALVSDPTEPYGRGSGAAVQAAAGLGSWSGRLEGGKPGFGTYRCYAKRLFGSQKPSADADIIKRIVLDAPEVVPAAGKAPTAAEVIAWAAAKFNVSEDQLIPEELSNSVATNDWVDDKGIRHVRLIQWSPDWEAT
jgi:hypothetical protein